MENFLHDLPDSAWNHCKEIEGTHLAAPIILIVEGTNRDAVFLFTQPHSSLVMHTLSGMEPGEEKAVSHGHAGILPVKSCAKDPNSVLAAELCSNISST